MRPHGSPKALEARRLRAVALLQQGLSLTEVARMVGSHPSSVMRWRNAQQQSGEAALEAKPIPGRPPKLTEPQRRALIEILLEGAMARGYSTELWTTQRIADVIQKEFGVPYHRDHVGRLLHSLDWSCQKPDRRALERDENKIEKWTREEWPRIKKGLRGWAPISSSSTNPDSS
jgi:transposase